MSGRDNAGAAVRRALVEAMGPGAVESLAIAQVRLAWSELMAESHLERGPLSSRVSRVTGGTVHVEASESALAQELTLRADALTWALNERMSGRPGANILVHGLSVSVGRIGS
ncbi:MAG: DciA family protein [Candidatus Limnocylindria bacterium]